jgi:hypothetical protein
MHQFFLEILTSRADSYSSTHVVSVSETVRNNALALLWSEIHANQKKWNAQIAEIAKEDPEKSAHVYQVLDELLKTYPKRPRKANDKTADDDAK